MLFTLVHRIIQPTLDRGAPWMVQPMLIYNPRNINTGAQPPTAIYSHRTAVNTLMITLRHASQLQSKYTSGKSFIQNEGGYGDGLKHQKGRNKGHYTAKMHKAT